jgi:hypothetical protein
MAGNLGIGPAQAKRQPPPPGNPPLVRFLFPKHPGELEGQRPSSAEEEGASPDDETKDLRVSAPLENRPYPRCIRGWVAAS